MHFLLITILHSFLVEIVNKRVYVYTRARGGEEGKRNGKEKEKRMKMGFRYQKDQMRFYAV